MEPSEMDGMAESYLSKCEGLLAKAREQAAEIRTAAGWFSETILKGQMVHLFGSGHISSTKIRL